MLSTCYVTYGNVPEQARKGFYACDVTEGLLTTDGRFSVRALLRCQYKTSILSIDRDRWYGTGTRVSTLPWEIKLKGIWGACAGFWSLFQARQVVKIRA
jgi:hypothetical protein